MSTTQAFALRSRSSLSKLGLRGMFGLQLHQLGDSTAQPFQCLAFESEFSLYIILPMQSGLPLQGKGGQEHGSMVEQSSSSKPSRESLSQDMTVQVHLSPCLSWALNWQMGWKAGCARTVTWYSDGNVKSVACTRAVQAASLHAQGLGRRMRR